MVRVVAGDGYDQQAYQGVWSYGYRDMGDTTGNKKVCECDTCCRSLTSSLAVMSQSAMKFPTSPTYGDTQGDGGILRAQVRVSHRVI